MNNLHTTSSIRIYFNDPTEFKFGLGVAMSAFNKWIFMYSAATGQYNLCGQISRSTIALMDG